MCVLKWFNCGRNPHEDLSASNLWVTESFIGQPLTLGWNPHLTFSATHMCVCAWSSKNVECSKPSNDFFIDYSATHTCVCAHSSNWLANHQLTSSATHMCVCSQQQLVCQKFVEGSKPPIEWFCSTHVCAHSSNCRDPHLIYSETHTCMPTAAIGRPTLDPWVQPYLFCNTHVCVLTAAIGLPKLLNVQSPQVTSSFTYSATHTCVCARSSNWSVNPQLTSSATHMCVCSQQQLVCKSFFNAQNLQVLFLHHICVCSQQQLSWPSFHVFRNTHVYAHSSNWSATRVEPSLDVFCNTHVCVLTAALGLPKMLNVQSPQMTSSLTYSATHTCVCAHSNNWLANHQLTSSATNMCVCAHSSSWSAKVCRRFKTSNWLILHHTCVHVCVLTAAIVVTLIWFIQKHTRVCPQLQLVGQPLTLGCNPHLTHSAKHMCVCSQQQLACQSCWMFKAFKWLLHWLILQHTHVCVLTATIGWPTISWLLLQHTCVCVLTAAVGLPKFVECFDLFCTTHVYCVCSQQQLSWPSFDLFRNTHVYAHSCNWSANPWPLGAALLILQHTCVCVLTAAVGLPKLLNVQSPQVTSSLTYSATHMCVLAAAIGRSTLNWLLLQHTCVCAHSSNWSAKVFRMLKASKRFFFAPHMCVLRAAMVVTFIWVFQKHTCVCPQQQLFGYKGGTLTWRFLQHTCVCAHSSTWSAKNVECSKPSNDFFIDLFCNTHMCVCSQQQLVGQPSIDFFCNKHVCVLTAAVGLPKFVEGSKPPIDLFCTTHVYMCVCSQQQLSWPSFDLFRNTHVYAHSCNWSANPWPLGATLTWLILQTHVCVLTAAIGLPKLLNVQSLQMTPSLTYSATHTCVCAHSNIGWPTISWLLLQHTCVCAHSSSWSAKVCRMFWLILHHTCVHACAHSSNCRDPHLIYSETHTCMPTAAIGRPTLDPWVQPYF